MACVVRKKKDSMYHQHDAMSADAISQLCAMTIF